MDVKRTIIIKSGNYTFFIDELWIFSLAFLFTSVPSYFIFKSAGKRSEKLSLKSREEVKEIGKTQLKEIAKKLLYTLTSRTKWGFILVVSTIMIRFLVQKSLERKIRSQNEVEQVNPETNRYDRFRGGDDLFDFLAKNNIYTSEFDQCFLEDGIYEIHNPTIRSMVKKLLGPSGKSRSGDYLIDISVATLAFMLFTRSMTQYKFSGFEVEVNIPGFLFPKMILMMLVGIPYGAVVGLLQWSWIFYSATAPIVIMILGLILRQGNIDCPSYTNRLQPAKNTPSIFIAEAPKARQDRVFVSTDSVERLYIESSSMKADCSVARFSTKKLILGGEELFCRKDMRVNLFPDSVKTVKDLKDPDRILRISDIKKVALQEKNRLIKRERNAKRLKKSPREIPLKDRTSNLADLEKRTAKIETEKITPSETEVKPEKIDVYKDYINWFDT